MKEKTKSFYDYLLGDFEYYTQSHKYLKCRMRVNANEDKCIVKVSSNQLVKTLFGYALIIDDSHVLFLKEWAVSDNYFGCEVLINRKYFNIKEWGNFPEYAGNDENFKFEHWLEVARKQENYQDEDGDYNLPIWKFA